jgi:hypothetical protein
LTSSQTFEGTDLDAVLARIRTEIGPDAQILSADKVRSGGVGGFFARERFEVVIDTDLVSRPEPERPAEPRVDGPTSLLALAEEINERERAAGPTLSTERPVFADLLHRLSTEIGDPDDDRDPPQAPAPAVAHPPVAFPLAVLGLPRALALPLPADADRHAALAERLGGLPVAPSFPTRAGSVLAVVGPRDDAIRVARSFATELGDNPADVVLASPAATDLPPWLVLQSGAEATERRRAWWRRERPTVVAVDADPRGPERWIADVLRALEPTLTCGRVDATYKPEDVAAWVDRIGGLDAIVLENLHATVSPAAVLALGIPVARIDGVPATPDAWATALTPRLAA